MAAGARSWGSGEGALAPLLLENSAVKLEVGASSSVGGCSGGENHPEVAGHREEEELDVGVSM